LGKKVTLQLVWKPITDIFQKPKTKINKIAKMSENVIAAPLSRIPGTSQLKEQHSKDLKTLSYVQLLEIKDRQSHFLSNK